jgi:hypothetical protein
MVFAELAGGVAQRLEQFRNGRILRANADIGPGHTHLGQTGANWVLAGDEGGPTSRAALLAIVIGEGRTFVANPVDVRGPIAHLASAVIADVPPADIVTPKDQDVRLACFSHLSLPQIA